MGLWSSDNYSPMGRNLTKQSFVMVERNMFNKPQLSFQEKTKKNIRPMDNCFFYIDDDILLEMERSSWGSHEKYGNS